jgi:hypothetical protein
MTPEYDLGIEAVIPRREWNERTRNREPDASVWIPGSPAQVRGRPGMTASSDCPEHASEDGIDMLEVIAKIELFGDLGV